MFILVVYFSLMFTKHESNKSKPEGFYGRTNRHYFNNCPKLHDPVFGYRVIKAVENLIPKEVEGKENLVRVGDLRRDGGYVLLDNLSNVSAVYSIGIGKEWSFDLDMASRGVFVYMFDPFFLEGQKAVSNNPMLKFYTYGVAGESENQVLISQHFKEKERLITIESMLKLDNNINKTSLILKIDVEGWEWDVFSSISSSILSKFSQIVVEFHWFDKVVQSKKTFAALMKSFENLNKTHQLIWVNGHNGDDTCVLGGVPIPLCIETTFVRRDENVIFKKYDPKRKRFDARNNRKRGKLLLWWVEADFDLDFLANSYKENLSSYSIET